MSDALGLAGRGIRFDADGGGLADAWRRAAAQLAECTAPLGGGEPVLLEGGPYPGAWLESTGSISAEVLARLAPGLARATMLRFARLARADGLLPYKITAEGPAFGQIQRVTPLARSAWTAYRLGALDRGDLAVLYRALAADDTWVARHRDTRGTGGVEAFCAFDTGHDGSPRFAGIPDTTPGRDPARFDRGIPRLPFVAPDLTAHAACQREHLALIAAELGEPAQPWLEAAARSRAALWQQCFDADDGQFYDRDALGGAVRVPSDVLLRVLACGIGDDVFFAEALRRWLLNPRGFFARHPFTTVARAHPAYQRDVERNSWGGPPNFLAVLRAPAAFERHGRAAELALVDLPLLTALARAGRFPQTYDPDTGAPGYAERYTPAMLWLLDAVERCCGVEPRPEGEVWFTGLLPDGVTGGSYRRGDLRVDVRAGTLTASRDGEVVARTPAGVRVVTDAAGEARAIVNVSPHPVGGRFEIGGAVHELELRADERVELEHGQVVARTGPVFVAPGQ
ncbi:MGH1-like glycoside hydrolase domain-containing protein [Gryllotalpicola ginsengisoli]|uniref:MGH1-like glycoside hydrolase domain-containing protein n=1 Tax=Gryllotalpicola ginsengisoli TaxID=444608 RepID=UPI0003B5BB08|nr:hypothetical protein [Gryllotalpicola ginsengisoli]